VFIVVTIYFVMTQSGNFWIHLRTGDRYEDWSCFTFYLRRICFESVISIHVAQGRVSDWR